jgi:predicted DNA-binding transcriptional regulator YafY
MRSARLTDESFEPREGFDPRYMTEPRLARLWHSPVVARWKVERGARALTDKAALTSLPFKTEEWLLCEVLADAGETIVLEPDDMRAAVAARAKELQTELALKPVRKKPAAGRA